MSESKLQKNPISRLQEICQIWKYPIPVYRESDGTYQLFGTEVTLTLEEITIAFSAYGRNKKESKANAADRALSHIQENYPYLMELPPLPELGPAAVSQPIFKKSSGSGLNKQKENALDMQELARETEKLKHVQVELDMGRLIQQERMKAKLNQKELAAKINERPQVISDYEQGKAIPNMAILKKIERALGVHLTGERAGELLGAGKRH